jgi:hypothetical protein
MKETEMTKTFIKTALRDASRVLKFAMSLPKDNPRRGVIISKTTAEINRLMKLAA